MKVGSPSGMMFQINHPVLLATQETPGVFTHNVVAMDNGIHPSVQHR